MGWRLLILGTCLALYLPGLGREPVRDRNEARRLLVAREMLEDGHWLVPHMNGTPYLKKPPLYPWLVALTCMPAGQVTPWWARLVAALVATAGALLLFEWCHSLLGGCAACLAALALVANYNWIYHARHALVDGLLALLVMLCLWSFWRAHHQGGSMVPAWVWMALATLTKGPAGPLVPLLSAGTYLASRRELRSLLRRDHLLGAALFLGMVLSWYLYAYSHVSSREAAGILRSDTLGKFLPHGRSYVPFLKALLGLLSHFFPWSLFLPGAIWAARRINDPEHRDLARYLLCWAGSGFAFFGLAATHRAEYLLPIYPALAFLTALGWQQGMANHPLGRGAMLLNLGCMALTALGTPLYLFWLHRTLKSTAELVVNPWSAALGSLLLIGGVLGLAACWCLKRWRGFLVVLGLSAGAYYAYVFPQCGDFAFSDPRPFCREVAHLVSPQASLRSWRFQRTHPYVSWYLKRKVPELRSELELARYLASPRRVYLLVRGKDWPQLEKRRLRVLLRWPRLVHRRRVAMLLANR